MLPTSSGAVTGDTIFMPVVEGLRRHFLAEGIDLFVGFDNPDTADITSLYRATERSLFEGVVIADILEDDPRLTYLQERRVPFVAFGRSGTQGNYPWIDLGFEAATVEAVKRLHAQGHTRIGLGSTARGINFGHVVEHAFRGTMADEGLAVADQFVFNLGMSEHDGYLLGDRWFGSANRPTALILANELMAVGLYRRLAEGGAVPGRDIALITLIEQQSMRFLEPRPTHFATDLLGLGDRLGFALQAAMRGDPPVQELWPMQLRVGRSDGPAAST